MSEPEEVILDGAHHVSTAVLGLWRRHVEKSSDTELHLVDVRGRIEFFTRAVFEAAPPIGVAEPPSVPNLVARWARRTPRHLVLREAFAWTDGASIRLPRALDLGGDPSVAFGLYRTMATGLAARSARGTPDALAAVDDPLVRDLFLLSEAAAVDGWLARELPGLAADLHASRQASAGARPPPGVLTAVEREVERHIVDALKGVPASGHRRGGTPAASDPAESLAWARDRAAELRAAAPGRREGRYRGLPPVLGWGVVLPYSGPGRVKVQAGLMGGGDEGGSLDGRRVRTMVRRPRVRQAPDDEDDDQVGMWMVQIDDPQESVEDPMGLQRPTDRDDDADPDDLADSLSELPEARLVPMPGRPKEVLASDDPPPRAVTAAGSAPGPAGIAYAEWDYRAERYLPGFAVVRERTAPAADPTWTAAALERHAEEIRRVRRQFERLRPHRTRLGRQWNGSDIDIGAYVTAYADRHAGHAPDDRFYEEVRPARRALSILLLVDVSGSTDSWVAETRRIVDVEKEALLLVCEALDALGDDYAVMGFSGEGPRGVSIARVKSFDERNGPVVRGRIAALEPDRFTRTGAAIRHATAELSRRATQHRLLLVLSDGKPNDMDVYEGRYGVEDTRQAVVEARLAGLDIFCLTVDRHAPAYLPRIFGPTGYAVLRHAATLPQVLIEVVRTLLRS